MKKINTLILGSHEETPEFGNFILFQEYIHKYDGVKPYYEVTRPILAVVLDTFIADQTVGFHYVRYVPEFTLNHFYSPKVESHIEWFDYIDILGIWKLKPSFKEYREAAKNRERKRIVDDFLTE